MSVRRSERLNPRCAAKFNIEINEKTNCDSTDHTEKQETQNETSRNEVLKQNQEPVQDSCPDDSDNPEIIKEIAVENSEEIIEIKPEPEIIVTDENGRTVKDNSATVKALTKMESELSKKKKGKKLGKSTLSLKRKLLNKKFGKLLTPKNAVTLLYEIKPNCSFEIQKQPDSTLSSFSAQIIHNKEIIGVGQGISKFLAKNDAAENAIKSIILKTMSHELPTTDFEGTDSNTTNNVNEYSPENLPWVGIASLAIYKMFSEWQSQGVDLLSKSLSKPKNKVPPKVFTPVKKELPANANTLHPAVVLNMVYPGLTAVEVEREDGPICKVKMEYVIDGKVYSGIGGNKKDAKKKAAKAVLEELHGLTYP